MKKPYFNQEERNEMKMDIRSGALLMFKFAYLKLKRSVYEESGLIKGFFIMRKINNIKLLGHFGTSKDPIIELAKKNPYSFFEIKNFIDKTNCSIEETQNLMDEMTSLGIGFVQMEEIIGGFDKFKKNETKLK